MAFLNKAFPLIEKQNTEARAIRNLPLPPPHTRRLGLITSCHPQILLNAPSLKESLAETGPFPLVTWKDDREAHLLGELIPLGSLQVRIYSLIHSFIHLIRNSAVCTQWRTPRFLFPSSPISEFPIGARL